MPSHFPQPSQIPFSRRFFLHAFAFSLVFAFGLVHHPDHDLGGRQPGVRGRSFLCASPSAPTPSAPHTRASLFSARLTPGGNPAAAAARAAQSGGADAPATAASAVPRTRGVSVRFAVTSHGGRLHKRRGAPHVLDAAATTTRAKGWVACRNGVACRRQGGGRHVKGWRWWLEWAAGGGGGGGGGGRRGKHHKSASPGWAGRRGGAPRLP